jgi:hypothetical protein
MRTADEKVYQLAHFHIVFHFNVDPEFLLVEVDCYMASLKIKAVCNLLGCNVNRVIQRLGTLLTMSNVGIEKCFHVCFKNKIVYTIQRYEKASHDWEAVDAHETKEL